MFDVGLMELAVIAVVAIIALGPDRLPEVARQAALIVRKARKMAHSARDELRDELGPEYADLQLRDLDPRTIVRKHIAEAMAEEDRREAELQSAAQSLVDGQPPPYDVEAT